MKMSKPNPKNFTAFKDPDGGEWIEITGASKYKGVIWRPFDIEMKEDDMLAFEVEQLTVEGQASVIEDKNFQELAGQVILDILQESIQTGIK